MYNVENIFFFSKRTKHNLKHWLNKVMVRLLVRQRQSRESGKCWRGKILCVFVCVRQSQIQTAEDRSSVPVNDSKM